MVADRRFDENEIARILEAASREALASGAASDAEAESSRGLTLAQVQQVAGEAGIPAEAVARATGGVMRGDDAPAQVRSALGIPHAVARTIEQGRPVSDMAWDRAVVPDVLFHLFLEDGYAPYATGSHYRCRGVLRSCPLNPARDLVRMSRIEQQGMDAVFDSVAANDPAFAGSYLNEAGQVVIAVAGSLVSEPAQIVARVAPYKRLSTLGQTELLVSSMQPPVTKSVEYSWGGLIHAKDQVLLLEDDRALSSVDADERLNRVVVGIVSAADTSVIRFALRTKGVRDDIVRLRMEPRANPTQQLMDRVRPIRGGLQIGPKGCTATLVANWSGSPVPLTNSHCTATVWGFDGGPTSQNWGWLDFGSEVHDLNTYRCGPWINRRDCRRADLAAYSLIGVDVGPGETPFQQGQIYRTVERLQGLQGLQASKAIDQQNPVIAIEGTMERVPVGWVLERIGITTGWQTGAVFESCVDRWIATARRIMLVCQTGAHLNSDPGDSGSPVFAFLANGNGLFAGISWGSTQGGTNAFFSDVTQMRQEMSGLVFTP